MRQLAFEFRSVPPPRAVYRHSLTQPSLEEQEFRRGGGGRGTASSGFMEEGAWIRQTASPQTGKGDPSGWAGDSVTEGAEARERMR